MAKRTSIPIEILKGKWSSGDPSLIPEGYCLQCRNVVARPNRLQTRDPFVYDSLMNVRGLGAYDDQTNKVVRLMAVDSSKVVYEKGTSGDAWSASVGTAGGTRLTDSTNYRGVWYGMMDNGSGLPTAAFSFDGTNFSTTPFNSSIQGRTVTAYLDRLFIAYPRVTVTPTNTISASYPTSFASLTGCTYGTITSGSTSIGRIFPTTTATLGVSYTLSAISLGHSASEVTYTIRLDFRNRDPINALPVSIQATIVPSAGYANIGTLRNTAVTVGQLGLASGNLFRVTQAGTTAVGAPAFNVALGVSVTDGGAIWIAEQFDTVYNSFSGDINATIPSLTDSNNQWTAITAQALIPWSTNDLTLLIYVNLYNNQTTSVAALNPVDIWYKDGLSDGDARKQNYGWQITSGDFYYEFVNTESASSRTYDSKSIIWSEVQQPKRIRASATYNLQETVGLPTAAIAVGGRYMVAVRNAWWQFIGNADQTSLDVIPIRRERIIKGVGCLGPRACDTFDDILYFIGEDGVYRYKAGGEPEELGGDAMREEIMDRGTNWVESQATYNMPLLKVNKRNREVWVYAQKGSIHVYNIDSHAWTVLDVASSAEIADFYFNANTRKMYVAVGGYGLARIDWSTTASNDTVDNTVNTYTCTKDVVTRPIEAFAPRIDACAETVGVFHTASASQTGQTLTAYVSFDRGSTYPYSDQITADITTPREPVYLYEMAPSITVKLSHVGKAGSAIWTITKLDIEAQIMRDEWPQTQPSGTYSG